MDVVDGRCLIDVGSVQLSLAPLAGRASVVTAERRGKGVGGKLVVDTLAPALRSEGAGTDIVFDGFAVPFGVEALPVALSEATIELGGVGAIETLLPKLPVQGKLKVSWGADGKSAGLDVFLKYEKKDGKPFWSGGAQLVLPISKSELAVGGTVFVSDGRLAGGGVSVDGINKKLPPTPLFLQKVEGSLVFATKFGFNFGVAGSLGPQVQGKRLLSLEGNMIGGALVPSSDCTHGADPSELMVKSKFSPTEDLERQGLFKTEMTAKVCNYGDGVPSAVELTGQVKIEVPPIGLGYEATQTGFVGTQGANLEGDALLHIPLLPDLHGRAIVSTKGFAACSNMTFVQGGFGYRWGQPGLPATFDACDLAPFRETAFRAAAFGAAASSSRTVTVPAGLPHVAFAARAATGAPRVSVSGPGGASFASEPGRALRSHAVVILPSEAEHNTFVVVNDPKPGKWKIASLDPARPLTKVALARGLPRPRVTARLRGHGARRTLTYKLAPLPGQTISFSERGRGIDHTLGSAHGRRGTITFHPTDAPARRRTIVAHVTQNGLRAGV